MEIKIGTTIVECLKREDLSAYVDLTLEAFGRQKRVLAEGTFIDAFSSNPARPHILVATNEGRMVGGVVVTPVLPLSNYTTFGISWLFVVTEARGRGYSKLLMTSAERYVCEQLLDGDEGDILLSTAVGTAFYEKLGYRVAYRKYNDVPVLVKTVRRNP